MSVQVIAETTPIVPEDLLVEQKEQLEAIVEILTPSEEEIELQAEKELEQQEIVEQQQELLTGISDSINELVTVLSEDDSVLTETATTNEILLALTDQVEQMNTLLDEKSLVVEAGANTVVTYGVLYVPLLIIIIAGWWFFKQFLTDFR